MSRIEVDAIGKLNVDSDAYYGIQSLRAKENFHITGRTMHPELIKSLRKIKKAAAITNRNVYMLPVNLANAIMLACDEVIAGKLNDSFIVDAIQGGAGTSANMNANEVIANRAEELLGGHKGEYQLVHPNDHVNMSQSTNDVYPCAGKLTIVSLLPTLIRELERLDNALLIKSQEFDSILKMGRTQLQDAVPMRLGQSFHAYHSMITRDINRIKTAEKQMHILNMGATAIGTAINVTPLYLNTIVSNISTVCNNTYTQAEDLFDATQNLDGFVQVSAVLKTLAINLSKLCNDLRLLSSGPRTGIGEINLPARQNGSSIMPGKINPVIPEVVSQIAFQVIGNDCTISLAAEAGQLELNAFEPVLFDNLFESIETLREGVKTLVDNCILGITANKEYCEKEVERSVGIATALCPYIGYSAAAAIAKEALRTGVSVAKLVVDKKLLKSEELTKILDPNRMTEPTLNEDIAFLSAKEA